jgi:hypothetical protein
MKELKLVFNKERLKGDTLCSNEVLRGCKKVRRFILVFTDGTLTIKENLIHTDRSGKSNCLDTNAIRVIIKIHFTLRPRRNGDTGGTCKGRAETQSDFKAHF